MVTRKDGKIVRPHARLNRETGCWEWVGYRNIDGYGDWKLPGSREHRAHRVAWILAKGPIPDGLHVLHHCDNPSCVYPPHLYLGTEADNGRDRAVRGRAARGERHGRRKYPHLLRGETVGTSKLTESDVLEIRRRASTGEPCSAIARDFDIGAHQARNIKNRRAWGWLD